MARDRSGRKSRIAHNQLVAGADTSQIGGASVFFGLVAWGLADLTHNYSWVALVVLLTAAWVQEANTRNRVAAAWNRRVVADDAIGMIGAATPAYSTEDKLGNGTAVAGLAVPTYTGGFHFFAENGGSHQFPPVEIVEIDRTLPYNRIRITTTNTVRPTILIYPQSWNIKAWEHLKDRKTYREGQ
ncbi:hypothetical protein [Streptomyces mirabilis]|uniref:hypothetical protein n=1 Tax=Streptomyces mirabilis TaxID=68239 RepID=UPI00225BA725|nr:hypothetical protein [Streptomyces mirabilis]MCX4612119.1 hypothetical protein [Streptomyces mirabilis]